MIVNENLAGNLSATAMRVPAEPSGVDERLDLIDALIYGDVFDCAVTLDELWRYARVAIDRDELRRRLGPSRPGVCSSGLVLWRACSAIFPSTLPENLPRPAASSGVPMLSTTRTRG